MAYEVKITKNFKKNVALCKRRGYPMDLLHEALDILIDTGTLPENTARTSCRATMLASGKPISPPTG